MQPCGFSIRIFLDLLQKNQGKKLFQEPWCNARFSSALSKSETVIEIYASLFFSYSLQFFPAIRGMYERNNRTHFWRSFWATIDGSARGFPFHRRWRRNRATGYRSPLLRRRTTTGPNLAGTLRSNCSYGRHLSLRQVGELWIFRQCGSWAGDTITMI